MAKTTLKAVSVYMTGEQLALISRVATLENRSVSNLLLTLGLDKAEQLGLTKVWQQHDRTTGAELKRVHVKRKMG